METRILLDLALILFATKIFGILTRKVHLPQVVGALVVGVIFGPALLGVVEMNEVISAVAEFGVLLILFEAGLETDLNKLRKSVKSLVVMATIGVVLSLGGGFALSHAFGLGIMQSMFIGVILTSSSISITVEVLNEMGKLGSKTGTAILGLAAVEDVFTIVIFSLAIGIGGGEEVGAAQIGMMLGTIALFFIFAVVCGFGVFKVFELLSIKGGMSKRLSVFGLAFCFLMAFIADMVGLAGIMGAYIAGLVLCNSRAEKYIEEKSAVLSFMFFSPVFFVSIGLNMSFAGLGAGDVLFAVLLVLVAVATKFVGCGLGAKVCGYSRREAAQIGAGMIARCELPVVAAAIGMAMGILDMRLFSTVMIMVITTALIAPVVLKLSFNDK